MVSASAKMVVCVSNSDRVPAMLTLGLLRCHVSDDWSSQILQVSYASARCPYEGPRVRGIRPFLSNIQIGHSTYLSFVLASPTKDSVSYS